MGLPAPSERTGGSDLERFFAASGKCSGSGKHSADVQRSHSAEQSLFEKQYEGSLQLFRTSLTSYPVEVFVEIQKQIADSIMSPKLLLQVLEQTLGVGDDTYYALKEKLEKDRSRKENELLNACSEANSLLHQYGPHFDDVKIVRFANAEESNTHKLLSRLGEEIRLQEQLLEAKEYELFQNFLSYRVTSAWSSAGKQRNGWASKPPRSFLSSGTCDATRTEKSVP